MVKIKRQKQLDWLIASVGLFCIIGLILLLLNTLVKSVKDEISNFGNQYIEDISKETSRYAQNEVNNLIVRVKGVADNLKYKKEIVSDEVFNYFGSEVGQSKFYKFKVVTLDGKMYDDAKSYIDVKNDGFFKDAIKGNSGLKRFNYTNEKDLYVVYAPIFNYKDEIVGILAGEYNLSGLQGLQESINIPIINGKGSVDLFESNGNAVFNSEDKYSLSNYSNYWDYFKNVEIADGYDYNQMREDIKNGKSGYIEYTVNGKKKVGYYRSVGVNKWYTITVLPNSVLYSYIEKISDVVNRTVVLIIISFLILVAIVIIYGRHFYKKIMKQNDELLLTNEKFTIAVSNCSNLIIEYDVAKNTLNHFGERFSELGLVENKEMPVEDVIKHSVIDKEYKVELEKLLQKVRDGEQKVSCILRALTVTGKTQWHKLTFTNIYNRLGTSVRAIGTIEDITEQKEIEFKYFKEEQSRMLMISDMKQNYVLNMDTAKFISGYKENKKDGLIENNKDYKEVVNDIILKSVYKSDYSAVDNMLSIIYLKEQFLKNNNKLILEYRELDKNNKIYWNELTINLVEDLHTREILAYIYIKDITIKKEEEISLKHKAEIDQLTGVFNRHTSEKLISNCISTQDKSMKNLIHALLTIDLDGFKSVNDTYGHIVGDELLIEMSNKLILNFRQNIDIVGRMGGDEFIVFVRDIDSLEIANEKARLIRDVVRNLDVIEKYNLKVSASVGISIHPKDGSDFKELYSKSDKALYAAKRAGKNTFKSYNISMEEK